MKKLLLLATLSIITFSNTAYFNADPLSTSEQKDFQLVSTKYVFNHAIQNIDEQNKLKKILINLDKDKFNKLEKNISNTENIFIRIFKTEKNLVPKIIKYIYFEPMKTEDKNILLEERQKLLVAFFANSSAKIYIKSDDKDLSDFYYNMLIENGAENKNIEILNSSNKQSLEKIHNDILKDTNKRDFKLTELRVLLITPSSKIKERLSLAYPILNKDTSGIEIDDFSYLDEHRVNLETTSEKTRIASFEELINGIY